jgi:hypothetical protein
MRRAVARGRIVPQSLSTDPRYGHLSLKAQVLYPLLWINCDDQGRLSGNPDEIKYAACPSVKEISAEEVPALLKEMETQGMITAYTTSKTKAIQMLDWWEEQRLQWAYPSRYPPAPGWTDHLRYHPTPKEIITENWPPGDLSPDSKKLPSKLPSALPSKLESPPSQTLPSEKEKEGGKRRGRGRLPSALGSRPPPSPTDLSTDIHKILDKCLESFRMEFGKVPAESPDTIIPREPNARERAQIRDLAMELVRVGGCPLSYIREVFREAAGQEEKSKKSVSYVRAILLDWLGIERVRPP